MRLNCCKSNCSISPPDCWDEGCCGGPWPVFSSMSISSVWCTQFSLSPRTPLLCRVSFFRFPGSLRWHLVRITAYLHRTNSVVRFFDPINFVFISSRMNAAYSLFQSRNRKERATTRQQQQRQCKKSEQQVKNIQINIFRDRETKWTSIRHSVHCVFVWHLIFILFSFFSVRILMTLSCTMVSFGFCERINGSVCVHVSYCECALTSITSRQCMCDRVCACAWLTRTLEKNRKKHNKAHICGRVC